MSKNEESQLLVGKNEDVEVLSLLTLHGKTIEDPDRKGKVKIYNLKP